MDLFAYAGVGIHSFLMFAPFVALNGKWNMISKGMVMNICILLYCVYASLDLTLEYHEVVQESIFF